MKKLLAFVILLTMISCDVKDSDSRETNFNELNSMEIKNKEINDKRLLACMYDDDYFPDFLVDKCKNVLLELSFKIESSKPKDLNELYVLTHNATNKINDLQDEFDEHGSEIETGARECLAEEFEFIVNAYGFEADIEELIATRDW